MRTRWEHTIDFIDLWVAFTWSHQVPLEVIDVKVEINRLVDIVVRFIITLTRDELEVMLGPSFTDPTVRARLQLQGF